MYIPTHQSTRHSNPNTQEAARVGLISVQVQSEHYNILILNVGNKVKLGFKVNKLNEIAFCAVRINNVIHQIYIKLEFFFS